MMYHAGVLKGKQKQERNMNEKLLVPWTIVANNGLSDAIVRNLLLPPHWLQDYWNQVQGWRQVHLSRRSKHLKMNAKVLRESGYWRYYFRSVTNVLNAWIKMSDDDDQSKSALMIKRLMMDDGTTRKSPKFLSFNNERRRRVLPVVHLEFDK